MTEHGPEQVESTTSSKKDGKLKMLEGAIALSKRAVLSALTVMTVSSSVGCVMTSPSVAHLQRILQGQFKVPSPEQAGEHPIIEFLETLSEEEWREVGIENEEEKQLFREALRYVMLDSTEGALMNVSPLLKQNRIAVHITVDTIPKEQQPMMRRWVQEAFEIFGQQIGVPIDIVDTPTVGALGVAVQEQSGLGGNIVGRAYTKLEPSVVPKMLDILPMQEPTIVVDKGKIERDFPEELHTTYPTLAQLALEYQVKATMQHEAGHALIMSQHHFPAELNLGPNKSIMGEDSGFFLAIGGPIEENAVTAVRVEQEGNAHLYLNQDPNGEKRDIFYSIARVVRKYIRRG